ncbi:MAG: ABC transporter substrate-binding protein [Proteobacteria bacterium]|nr:ABC transporter substrate-binding protein [Pseudomonadota bacterium]
MTSLRSLTFALVLAAAPAGPALLAPVEAQAQRAREASAEAFIQTQAQRAIGILADRNLSRPQKADQFRTFIDQAADVPRITTFVLGKYARTASPAQRAQFAQVFRAYATSVYERRLGEYGGERVQVTGSAIRRPGDVVVSTLISGGRLSRPETVRWRVVRSGSSWRVVDVEVRGVYLAVTQQADFTSTLDNAGGDLNVLINQLRRQTAARR